MIITRKFRNFLDNQLIKLNKILHILFKALDGNYYIKNIILIFLIYRKFKKKQILLLN